MYQPVKNQSISSIIESNISDSAGHIRCLGVVPVDIQELLKEIESEIEAETSEQK